MSKDPKKTKQMASGDVFGMGREEHSIVRLLFFNGEDYAYQKTRMRLFVQANDYEVWKIIMKGPLIPTKKVDDREVPKEEWEWDEKYTKIAQLNAKAMHTLFCALSTNEYNRVSLCDMPKKCGISWLSHMKGLIEPKSPRRKRHQ